MSKWMLMLALGALMAVSGYAQQDEETAPGGDQAGDAQGEEQEPTASPLLTKLGKPGPMRASMGNIAEVDIPEGMWFIPKENCRELLDATQNIAGGNEIGIVYAENWWAVFEFNDIGYIKDPEKEEIDEDALMEGMREGNKQGNEARKKKGWDTLDLEGWSKVPSFNPNTKNLSWSLIYSSSDGSKSINHMIRILGRRGTVSATLAVGPAEYSGVLTEFEKFVSTLSYKSGEKYSEYKKGDKLAEYGLAALIAGGTLAVGLKTGIIQKLLKPLLLGLAVIGGAIAKFWRRLFGGKKATQTGSRGYTS